MKDVAGRTLWSYTYELDKAQKIIKVVRLAPNQDLKYIEEVSYDCR